MRLRALLLVATASLAAPAAARAQDCASQRAGHLRFAVSPDRTHGTLSWRGPSRSAARHLAFRVLRDGKVVGQTRAHHMTMRISAARQQRLQVRVVSAHGRQSACRATFVARPSALAPLAPHDLVVASASETSATLHWAPGIARTGRLTGYRLLRDQVPLGTVHGTKATVMVSSNRSATFTVAAVDSSGQLSAPSNAVTVVTGHRAPTAPQNVRVSNAADDRADVAWDPSTASSGRIVGYRVMRDDAMLTQITATGLTVGGLMAATDYAVRVMAVDSLGYLSAPSAPAALVTAAPPPSTGSIPVFLLATTGQSFADLRTHYQRVGTVYPTYFECAPDGSVTGQDDPQVTAWAHIRQIKVVPRLDCQDPGRSPTCRG